MLASDTFALDSIQLMDANGNPINNWKLVNLSTGTTVFTPNGPMTTPEPGAFTLFAGLGLSGVALLNRRRAH